MGATTILWCTICSCIRGKGPSLRADICGICPGYNSHGYLPISRAYATDICGYPVGGTRTLTLTEKFSIKSNFTFKVLKLKITITWQPEKTVE